MRRNIVLFTVLILFFLPSISYSGNAQVSKAVNLIKTGKYDEAISILKERIVEQPNDADAYLQMARAYHWKKEFNTAYKYYKEAAIHNHRYKTEIIGLLDELEKWQEIIDIAAPEIKAGNKTPSILGSLMTAYTKTKLIAEADRVLNILKNTLYQKQWQIDYKNYVLAYYFLSRNKAELAKKHLRKIVSPGYRKYARTSPKFKKLYSDPEFIEITK